MKLLIAFLFLISFGAAYGSQSWYSLRTTFKPIPVTGFWSQPRTEKEAINKGYTKISDCNEGNAFPGKRYIPYYKDPNIVLIYDVKGYIAGMQSIVNKVAWDVGYGNVSNNSMYQPSNIRGEPVFLTTAYFVNPSSICSGGRTPEEYKNNGTGYTLIFQNGTDISPKNLIIIPLLEKDLMDSEFWKKHKCLFNMGMHYFNLHYDPEESCENLFPVQLLYEEGHLHGFVWQHLGDLPGDLWEHSPAFATELVIINPPTCIVKAIRNVGFSGMHVYFKNYLSTCIF